jgi:hypothetical protein
MDGATRGAVNGAPLHKLRNKASHPPDPRPFGLCQSPALALSRSLASYVEYDLRRASRDHPGFGSNASFNIYRDRL